MKSVRSRFKVNRARGQEPFERMGDTGLHALPMFAGRTGHASQPSAFPRGKAPRARNLARGVSDDLRGAVSSARALPFDPHTRPLTPTQHCSTAIRRFSGRTDELATPGTTQGPSKVARDLSAPNFRCRRMIRTGYVQLCPNCLREAYEIEWPDCKQNSVQSTRHAPRP